jgi:glycosyltransferase involved in cell wall biosynthesis/SAM-dependent methyltransferase
MDICTIIAKNYVAQARVLARSFAEHNPGGSCHVLLIDDFEGYIDPAEEPFEILTPAQIGCEEFDDMAVLYTVLELSTAVKPWLLAHLLREGRSAITYLDPDIRIFGSLQRLDDLAREHTVVLTPHNTTPVPDDGERPSQVDILLAGVYNLGYVSLGAGAETDRLLRWWQERLLFDCRVDPLNGYFVDQRWFDLAPGLVSDRAIVREPQYNLAYWNLYSRRLAHGDSGYTADGEPLGFFHFSGFDAERPDVLSRHQTRVTIAPGSALERICNEYAAELYAAGYGEAGGWTYTYGQLPSGIPYSRLLRKLYVDGRDRGELCESPFTEAGAEAFMAWLAAPEPDGPPGVSRVLAEIYRGRPDLQAAYTDLEGDPSGLIAWAAAAGASEEPVLGRLAASRPQQAAPPAPQSEEAPAAQPAEHPARAPLWGVNVVGYFRSELGTGEAARQIIGALDVAGVPVLPLHGRTIPLNRQGHQFTYLDHTAARYPVNLICMNADMLGEFAEQAGPRFFAGRHSIGVWFWEVEEFPAAWHSAFDHVDELWLPTEHIIHAVGAASTVPVVKITLPVQMPPVGYATREELELPEGHMFLFSFDHHSVFERKNPLAVIDAYTRAFDPGDGAVLVIKSINADSAPRDHARLLQAAGGRPDVHVIDGYLSAAGRDMLVASCDCYVSLHRAEGFGLTMAEAMYLGKPVIATGYSGNLDFMTGQNSFLVEHRMVPIGPNAAPYPADAQWAEPDVGQAASLMREVFDSPEHAAERARRGAESIRRTHSAAAAAEVMGRRLEKIRERDGEHLVTPPPSLAAPVEQRVAAGPVPGSGSRGRGPRGRARRLALRLMKPFTAYQQTVNAELAGSVGSLERGLSDVDMDLAERNAALLAETRGLWEQVTGLARATDALQRAVGVHLQQRVDDVAGKVQRMEWEDRAIPYMQGAPFGEIAHPLAGVVEGYRLEPGTGGEVYRSFEDVFRGSEELIRERQRVFLSLLSGHAPVLDLGCGRGEFLDLLRDRGIRCLGVDSDPGMVRRCREKGHDEVVEADGLDFLEGLEDGSLGAIFCAQVIEHLPYDALVRLLALARGKLRDDGILLAETVNPHCPPALKTFWVDPTHQHPIFPEVALQLARSAGFSSAFVFHPNGSGDVGRDRFSQGEYAVAAGGPSLLPAPGEQGGKRRDRVPSE